MSYPAQAPPQQPVTSPVAVRVAAGLLVVMALGGLVYGAIGLALMSGIIERFQTSAIGAGVPVDDIDGGSRLLRGVPIAAAFVGVVSALLLAALVVGLLRGSPAVRVATWVVCGLGVVGGALTAAVGFVQRIDEFADEAVLKELGIEDPFDLTGLYSGRPMGEQSSMLSGELPPIIHLYRRPLLDEWADSGVSLEDLITHVIVHEVGHHFGFSDEDMHAIENDG